MIIDYGFSVVGKSHIKKDSCCQDYHCIKRMKNGWIIAAVADGVGSAKNSHIGSKIAAETVVEFCDECMPWDYSVISIKSMLRTAYNYAFKMILKESEKSGEPIESFDTTLSMVIYDGQRIIYGHSGDGAIFGLTIFGDFIEITRPQKSVDGVSVIPLRGGYTQWVIDTYEEDLVAVLLMTDGMLETLCHYLLRDQERKINRVYVPLASYFADPYGFNERKIEDIKKEIFDFIVADKDYETSRFYTRLLDVYKWHIPKAAESVIETLKKANYPVSLMQAEQDDKTIVGLINTELPFDNKEESFYSEPDWNLLQEAWYRKAYPHLYSDRQKENDNETTEQNVDNTSNMSATYATEEQNESSTDATTSKEPPKKTDSKTTTDSKEVPQNAELEVPKKADATTECVATSTPHTIPTTNIQQPNSNTQDISLPIRATHEKPRKKSLIGKIGDLFD